MYFVLSSEDLSIDKLKYLRTLLMLTKKNDLRSHHGSTESLILMEVFQSSFHVLQVASFLLYLSDVEEGGETMFPFEVR